MQQKPLEFYKMLKMLEQLKQLEKIEIGGNSSESMGSLYKTRDIKLIAPHTDSGEETESSIELKAGSNNIGIYAKGASTVNFDGITPKIIGGEGQKNCLSQQREVLLI